MQRNRLSNALKKQKQYYSEKKKNTHLKTQIIVDKNSKCIICTEFCNCKKHDFRLFKESKIYIDPSVKSIVDTGFWGITKLPQNSVLPKKKSKRHLLTKQDKTFNKKVSSDRVLNEYVIGSVKRFKIIADKYRNRRKRFGLRFNLIAGIYNFELSV